MRKLLSLKGCAISLYVTIGVLLFAGFAISALMQQKNTSSKKVILVKGDSAKNDIVKVTWKYSQTCDAMTDTPNSFAYIESTNHVVQEFPYNGKTFATITVRHTKRYGTDVIIEISKGQITGNSLSGDNYVTVRFDDLPSRKYFFNESSDYDSKIVFLIKSKDFIERSKKAKDIKVEIPLYQYGRTVFYFHVDECLKWKQ